MAYPIRFKGHQPAEQPVMLLLSSLMINKGFGSLENPLLQNYLFRI